MSVAGMISVVVIGRNEGERLQRCLASVAAMERAGRKVELIYVDSGSTDDSLVLAAAMGARTVALRPERPTAALGRNAGWRVAQGELILFLDGDTVLAPDFVRQALAPFIDERIAIVWGHRRELFPEDSVYNRVLDFDWIYAPGYTAFCGGDALMRRRVLEQMSGFDEALIAGEEPELCRRILGAGYKILHLDCSMTGHDLAMTRFAQYWRRATRAGHAYAEVSERFRETGEPFWTDMVRRTRSRALMLVGAVVAVILLSLALRSIWPVLLGTGAFLVLVLRTAWKARWKSGDWAGLIGYGLHSQVQQVPIFVGQMLFYRNRQRGLRAGLVEYKRN